MSNEPQGSPSRLALFRLFLAEKRDPDPFYRALADQTVRQLGLPVSGRRILDLGAGGGQNSEALERAGATVISLDPDLDALRSSGHPPLRPLVAEGQALPLPRQSFDGVLCSNVLEHTPDPLGLFDEVARVLRPGGWCWLSWTNWYSPWGGHDITPFHYLGPVRGLAVYRRLRGEPRKNVPGEGLFPAHIGPTLRALRTRSDLQITDVRPRYYPSQRWILRIPGLREVLTWNCLITLERVA
jgi:SAM-dependent methyltransferase